MSLELRDYQRTAVEVLKHHHRQLLVAGMGAGKTATILSALEPRHLPVLVLTTPRIALHVWPDEGRVWRPDLNVQAAVGSPAYRAKVAASGADVVSASIHSLAWLMRGPFPWRTIVVDESSMIRTPSAGRTKAIIDLSDRVPYMWLSTATPTPRWPGDLWSQIRPLDGGAALGEYVTHFRREYCTPQRALPSGVIPGWDMRSEEHTARMMAAVDHLIWRVSSGVELPDITFTPVVVDLPASAKRVYRAMVKDMVAEIDTAPEPLTAVSAGHRTNLLQQITAGAAYHSSDDGVRTVQPIHKAKAEAAAELVEQADGPVLILYSFKFELDLLRAVLGDDLHTLDEPESVERWNRKELPVLAAHPASMAHGLNLQHGGHTIIWTTVTTNPELWTQANGRLRRPGQEHPVSVLVLEADGTLDSKHRAVSEGRESAQESLLDGLRGVR